MSSVNKNYNETPTQVLQIYDARQPKGLFVPKRGVGGVVPVYERDQATHIEIERLIESSFLKTPAESIYQFNKNGSGVHVNIVTLAG